MYRFTTISFPGLGIELDPVRVLSLGPLNIHLYGLIIACGLAAAVLYACRRSSGFGLKEDDIVDGVLYVTPFAILCARLYYCIFSWEMYRDNPISILYIWEGGLAIYGGVLGAIVGVTVYCKFRKIPVATLLDLVALGFLIGQSAGRWGNFFNREAAHLPNPSCGWAFSTPIHRLWSITTPRFCMNRCGILPASCCCTSCPKSAAMTVRLLWAMPPGTAWAGL